MVYKESHLNKKSNECAILWNIWFELRQNGDPLKDIARQAWCKCADELGAMVHEEVKTNPRYKDLTNNL